jgi:hypothetical protein
VTAAFDCEQHGSQGYLKVATIGSGDNECDRHALELNQMIEACTGVFGTIYCAIITDSSGASSEKVYLRSQGIATCIEAAATLNKVTIDVVYNNEFDMGTLQCDGVGYLRDGTNNGAKCADTANSLSVAMSKFQDNTLGAQEPQDVCGFGMRH